MKWKWKWSPGIHVICGLLLTLTGVSLDAQDPVSLEKPDPPCGASSDAPCCVADRGAALRVGISEPLSGTPAVAGAPKIGEPAPEIAGEDTEGVPFKLSDYRGKVVVLSFWAFW